MSTQQRPNIIFLLNDHQAYYRRGWDSGPKPQRPHFDRLASEGVNFTHAYTACPLCMPARRTMLTGVFPHNHRLLQNNETAKPSSHELYLDTLAEEGYRNFYFGKWHSGPGCAYDHHCEGFSYTSYGNPYLTPEYAAYIKERGLPHAEHRVERVFRRWQGEPLKEGELYTARARWLSEHASGITVTPKETHEAFFLANRACDTLRELAGSEQPFHLRVDFWGPHQPYFPTQEFVDLYNPEDIPVYGNFNDELTNKPEVYRREGNDPLHKDHALIIPSPLPWSEWQKVISRCYANITMVDAAGGMILDALDELGLAENTFVVWTTDHGDALACHGGHFDKSSYMPEEMMRVPMATRWPAKIGPGQTSEELVSLIDVAPTILDVAGTQFNNPVDGTSLVPLCTGDTEWRDDLMSETHGHTESIEGRMLVTGRFKYVATRDQMHELYDLDADPYELNNLINDPAHVAVLDEMRQRLRTWQARTGDKEEVIG